MWAPSFVVEKEDRRRFEFVKDIVSKVEIKKIKETSNAQDKVDGILLKPFVGIPLKHLQILRFQIQVQ